LGKIISVLVVFFFGFWHVYAHADNFAETADEITDALTNIETKQEIKTRSLKAPSSGKTRGLTVVRKENGKIVEKTVLISERHAVRSANIRVEFDFDAYTIRSDSFLLLNELGKALTSERLRGVAIILRGHTDSDGDIAYNLDLSLKRAFAVKKYLIDHFYISPSFVKVEGYGEGLPLVPNTSELNKQVNRRVEIAVDTTP
jgi:outer membrane protein OmpA-like peptidoglycan-associated protein